jgi:hypothetical protein
MLSPVVRSVMIEIFALTTINGATVFQVSVSNKPFDLLANTYSCNLLILWAETLPRESHPPKAAYRIKHR